MAPAVSVGLQPLSVFGQATKSTSQLLASLHRYRRPLQLRQEDLTRRETSIQVGSKTGSFLSLCFLSFGGRLRTHSVGIPVTLSLLCMYVC
jgi:hypothetical protein